MPSKVAPPKCTGVGGTFFESKVCAWFLAHMLANEPPLGPGPGHLKRVDFQVRPEEWFLDDLILTLTSGAGQHRCALSVKSNTQFTRSKAPVDFVRIAWEQFLGGSSPFDETSDFMGLVTAPLPDKTREALNFVVNTAKKGDPQLLPARYAREKWSNLAKRSMFESFSCPDDLAQAHSVKSEDTGRLLARLCFFQFDFEAPVSEYEKQAIERCRRALRSGKVEEGARLWTHLWQVSVNRIPKGGCINRLALLDELRFQFELADMPDHRRAGLQQDPIPPRFASLRAAIIEYALGNDERLIDTFWPQTEEVWLALFGIDEFTRRCWEPRHRELADMSRPLFEQWMARGRASGRHIAALAAWLEKEAADPVRLHGLVWLYRVLTGGDTKKRKIHQSAQDPVACLLHVVWQKDESRIRGDLEAFAAFRGLLRWLTDQQNPVALELVGRLGGLQ